MDASLTVLGMGLRSKFICKPATLFQAESGAVYHVINCGNRPEAILHADGERQRPLEPLAERAEADDRGARFARRLRRETTMASVWAAP